MGYEKGKPFWSVVDTTVPVSGKPQMKSREE